MAGRTTALMLLRAHDDAVVCIGQPAHAWVSGQLARAWRGVEPRGCVSSGSYNPALHDRD